MIYLTNNERILSKHFLSVLLKPVHADPKWVINIESQNRTYVRAVLAASATKLIDEIAYCPKEFFARIRSSRKQTFAVCERCGNAYCSRHIDKMKNSYYCRDHSH